MATIARLRPLQEWFARSAILSIVAVLALPVIRQAIRLTADALPSFSPLTWPEFPDLGHVGPIALVLIGHIALLVFLVRRWQRRTSHGAASAADDMDRARTRRREPVTIDDEDTDP